MALQSSGEISFVDLQGEWGGINPIRLSNYYLGSLPTGRTNYGSIPSSGQISLSDFYGTNAAVAAWLSLMQVGSWVFAKTTYYGFSANSLVSQTNGGSMTDTTIDNFNNYTFYEFYWWGANRVTFSVGTAGLSNSGWTSITVKSAFNVTIATFNRASASSFDNSSTLDTSWTFNNVTTNPFGSSAGGFRNIEFIV